jgi:hypothetical protein
MCKKIEPRSEAFKLPNMVKIIISGLISFISIGIFLFASLLYWSKKLKSKKLFRFGLASIPLSILVIASSGFQSSKGSTSTWIGLSFIVILGLVVYAHVYIFKLLRSDLDNSSEPDKAIADEINTPKDVVAQNESPIVEANIPTNSNLTTGDSSWSVVESTIFEYLAARKGKQFTIEILSNAYTGIYFQGYSEPGGYITVEAASNISVKPPLEAENRKGLIKIGWEPPSDGLPNFIKFLDLKESENSEIAKLFVETLQDGYKLEIGTFKVEV